MLRFLVLVLLVAPFGAAAKFQESDLVERCQSLSHVEIERAAYCLFLAEMTEKPDIKVLAYSHRGRALVDDGLFDLAVLNLGKALAIRPSHSESLQTRAYAYVHLKEFGDAWRDARKFRERDDLDNYGMIATAEATRHFDGVEAGVREFEHQIAKVGKSFPYFFRESAAVYADMLIDAGQVSKAFTIYDRLVEIEDTTYFLEKRAGAHSRTGNHTAAIQDYEALRGDVAAHGVERALARLYSEAPAGVRDLDKALAAALKALRSRDAGLFDILRLVRIHSLRGDHGKAAATYLIILKDDPELFPDMKANLVRNGFATGDLEYTDQPDIQTALEQCSRSGCELFDIPDEKQN